MSNRENILTPVGRLVQGSLYEPQTTDAEGNLLVYRTGTKTGQPRIKYYFAIAIPKGSEKHWAETSWGVKIWTVGHAGFPNGQANSPTFAWKIIDGDSQVPNGKGTKWCDKEGYPTHWILNFSSDFAPSVVNENGSAYVLERDAINPGDYIQIAGFVRDNESQQKPGVFLNHTHVAFVRYGKRISFGIDPKTIGFGRDTIIPAGASLVPLSDNFNPINIPVVPTRHSAISSEKVNIPVPAPITPYPQILTPPPVAPVTKPKIMTSLAQGTYEQYTAMNWTDAQLIQHGLMQA